MKLYGKLIFWFLVANIVAVGFTLLVSSRFFLRSYSDDDATHDGKAAAQVYEAEGAMALEHWLRHRHRDGVFGMLSDAQGRPLAHGFIPGRGPIGPGRPPPPDPDEPPPEEDAPIHSATIVSAAGNSYRWTAAVGPPHGRRAHERDLLLHLIVACIAIAAVALLAAQRISRPIGDLRTATLALADGKLDTRAPVALTGRGDEIGELGRSFNEMAERLQRLLESQRQLLRDVSHELRSPLARLRIASELAREAPDAAYFDRIEQEAGRLEELIGQVLLLARLESPQSPSRREPVDVTALTRQICDDAQLEAQARKVSVRADLQDGCAVMGRPDLLQSAIENVVRNAVRYAAEGTEVAVEADCDQRRWRIAVSDRGPGVPAGQLDAIFKPFHRVSSARERESPDAVGGYGLGLAIAERAVNVHGGSIAAQNRDGGGLRVEIVLPL